MNNQETIPVQLLIEQQYYKFKNISNKMASNTFKNQILDKQSEEQKKDKFFFRYKELLTNLNCKTHHQAIIKIQQVDLAYNFLIRIREMTSEFFPELGQNSLQNSWKLIKKAVQYLQARSIDTVNDINFMNSIIE